MIHSLGDDVERLGIETVARHLHVVAVLEHRHLVHAHLFDGDLAVLLLEPEIDVVVLVLAAVLAEIRAGEKAAVLLEARAPADGCR